MNLKELVITVDMADNPVAIAIASGAEENPFIASNRIFSTVFPSILSPKQLRTLISNKTENKTVIEHNNGYWELLDIKLNTTDSLFILKNISFEMMALKQLKIQLSETSSSFRMYSDILEKDFPIGVMIVDKQFNVIYANQKLKQIFHVPSLVNLQKCYNYFKELKPCDECIVLGILSDKKKKRTFSSDDNRMITAEVHPLDEKFIITFRDTTREIHLIKEIKRQHEELQNANNRIADQNDILKRLSNINIRIGQMKNLESILETVVNSIIETFSCKKGAILLFSESGKIKNAYFSFLISPEEKNVIIKRIDIDTYKHQPEDSTENSNPDENLTQVREEPGIIKILDNFFTQDMKRKDIFIGKIFLSHPLKPIDQSVLELFLSQVTVYLDNLELNRKLEEVAYRDALTGVFNRYYFGKQFEEERELSLRFGQPLSMILIDVNGLKEVNDTAGHEAGDLMLRHIVALLGQHVPVESIYRLGGDEFVLLLPNCPEHRMNSLIEKLKKVQQETEIKINKQTFYPRFCLGGACSTEFSHDRLKDEADKQMYSDKTEYYKNHKKYR